jgi:two-component system CheB/CheR fusion protein
LPRQIVAIGASAGGFEEIRTLLRGIPPDSGLGFVIILHLGPTRESLAAQLFGKETAMPVREAKSGMRVEANHVYVIPPDCELNIGRGVLRVVRRPRHEHLHLPIDRFFSALAIDRREHAIGIILSGAGSDGAIGARAITAEGGIVLVQAPESAHFDSMPRSAIATASPSHVVAVAEMPRILVAYANGLRANVLRPLEQEPTALGPLLDHLHARFGSSFAGYKQGTLLRRVHRRMRLTGAATIKSYTARVKKNAEETAALFKDLLIGVTEFFRNAEAWEALRTDVIEPLIAAKKNGEPIRVWVPGCSTGEEAYSLGVLLLDALTEAGKACPLRIFGTDVNEDALEVARDGLYPAGIAAHVAPKHLHRYFIEGVQEHHYRVVKELREVMTFGVQNLLADPPFSRLDLISCRNLLIYLEPSTQETLITLFHFALRPGGTLFLGSAETVGGRSDLFKPISRQWRIYRHVAGTVRTSSFPIHAREVRLPVLPNPQRPQISRAANVSALVQRVLLDRFAPAAVLVNSKFEALYFCGQTENFLSRPRGVPTQDVLALAREGLRSRLRSALRDAMTTRSTIVVPDARIRRGAAVSQVKITVTPVNGADESNPLLLMVFEDVARALPAVELKDVTSVVVHQLEEELKATKDDLQNTIERLGSSNEDLRTANEEVVSTNEELQSINEELESSKEELQSLNEELNTSNQQLQSKLVELERANSDIRNLLSSSEIATLFLARDLTIKWFTPATRKLFNVLPSDVGRPLSDLASATRAGVALVVDARAVLRKHKPVQRELNIGGGRCLLRRIVAYRTEDHRVDGVVVTFTDITESQRALQSSLKTERTLARTLEQRAKERAIYLRALAVTEERERRNLAQNLHDDLGQTLAIAKIKLSALGKDAGESVRAALKAVGDLIEQASKAARSAAFELSPAVLYELGLNAALELLGPELKHKYGLSVKLRNHLDRSITDRTVGAALFRALRELLVNVARHADVGSATVTIDAVANQVQIKVADGGSGFDPKTLLTRRRGFGLVSVRERLRLIGGDVRIDSKPGGGTRVTLMAPLKSVLNTQRADKKSTKRASVRRGKA